MKDLTQGSITRHILTMAAPIAIGMGAQMAYQVIDMHFVSGLGSAAVAGVSDAGILNFIVMALTQALGVGSAALIAHAAGRKDKDDANLLFNQSVTLSLVAGLLTALLLAVVAYPYMRTAAPDQATVDAGVTFMFWIIPGFALMFPMGALGSALRGTGMVQPTIVIQMITVVLNAILAPILIAGWGTGVALGVKGAGLASSISVAVGLASLYWYFRRFEHFVAFDLKLMPPQFKQWRRMFNIGLPAGGEFALMAVTTFIIAMAIRKFGVTAQSGFGLGSRALQTVMLPAMAIAFAAGPIAGQNFGAKNPARVRETFRQCALIGAAVMITITMFAQLQPGLLLGMFKGSASDNAIAAVFLQMVSWNFVAQGLVFTCSSMFQGLGNTMPALLSSSSRLFLFAVPVIWVSAQPDFKIEHVWYLSIASVTLQAVISVWLLQREFKKRLVVMEVRS